MYKKLTLRAPNKYNIKWINVKYIGYKAHISLIIVIHDIKRINNQFLAVDINL